MRWRSIGSNLILSIFCEILNPWWSLVSALINYFEISHLEAGDSEEGNLEFDIDGLLFIGMSFWRFNGWQFEFSIEDELSESIKFLLVPCVLLNAPLQCIVLRDVWSCSGWRIEDWALDILRNWNKNVNIVCNAFLFVVAFNFHQKSDFRGAWSFGNDIDRKQRFNSNVEPITHQLKLSVGWNESYESFILKLSQSHTLMEFDIVELNSFVSRSPSLSFIVSLVVQPKLQIGHSWKLAICVHDSNNFRFDDIVGGTDQHR